MSLLLIIKTVIMGIVEGVTEFLPISSTGHLIIVEQFLRLSNGGQLSPAFISSFDVLIQPGAILAIVVLFWKTLWPFGGTQEENARTWKLWGRVIIGTIPAAVLGFLFDKIITGKLFNPLVVAITLVFYGIVLVVIERILRKGKAPKIEDVHNLTLSLALAIGFFQVLALIPGTSRSAATIVGAMILGLSRSSAAEFSFFMAIPIMAGASVLTLYKHASSFTGVEWEVLLIGFVVSFLLALVVVRAFMNFIRKRDFVPFGYYRIVLGALVIVLLVVGVLTMHP
ncbi:MAG TPA: undecaprenyl-diphosphate phosphatase [Spirochaetia bacterium]|nr:undecaprenyl-diphosphate phosphatase [Spirochaetia bacterium]